jgi:hypothetical protein
MKKVGPRKWVEIDREPKEDFPKQFSGGTAGDPDYWKTHEPVFTPRPEEGTVYWPQFVSANDALKAEVAERNLKSDSSECSAATAPDPSVSTDPNS